MCGRFILIQEANSLKKHFGADFPEEARYRPSYNISPGQKTVVITGDFPKMLRMLRFGLFSNELPINEIHVNIRPEEDGIKANGLDYHEGTSIFDDPVYGNLMRMHRCLVPADAYIEFPEGSKFNKPYVIYLRNKVRPFTLAGIWNEAFLPDSNEAIRSFSILTTSPNRLVARLHSSRMPVIFHREDEERWLCDSTPQEELSALMKPYPAELMNGYPIAPTIINPKANDPGLIHPAGPRIFPEG